MPAPAADFTSTPRNQGLWIRGRWERCQRSAPVTNKFTGREIGSAAIAAQEDVDRAIEAAATLAPTMADLPAHRRALILEDTARMLREQREPLARSIAQEAGSALKFARIEVDRAANTFALAGEEARRIHGETLPMDAVAAGEGYFGFWQRRPVGVVAAITPFNFPLNLVAHKLAPAIAAGNSVVLKPASATPLTAGVLCEILAAAGLPPGALNMVTGPGGQLGEWLVSDPRVAKITFTGSAAVGRSIIVKAGIKKVTLELGNNAPVVVAPDADLDLVARCCALGAFYNAGQTCISVQRIYAAATIQASLCEKLVHATEAMRVGDPLDETVDVGPMIQVAEAERIERWVEEATAGGAIILTGARREGSVYWPTLLQNTQPEMKVMAHEAFAPVASVVEYETFADALSMADASDYGLQAAIFTRDIDAVLEATRRLNYGGIIVNDMPTFRLDHMPYGGNRNSGLGREGVRFAIEEMTNIQMVAIRKSSAP